MKASARSSQRQQIFDHHGSRQFGAKLSGGAGDLSARDVKLTAVSKAGREAVIGLLRPGDFFGEGCLVGKRKHVATASARVPLHYLSSKEEK